MDSKIDENEKFFISHYEEAFKNYEIGDFKKAKNLFEACHMDKPKDQATILFIERCIEFIERGKPDNWDGTYTLSQK